MKRLIGFVVAFTLMVLFGITIVRLTPEDKIAEHKEMLSMKSMTKNNNDSLRMEYVIESVPLTHRESQAFTPLYKQYRSQIEMIEYELHNITSSQIEGGANEMLNSFFELKEQKNKTEKYWATKFLTILSPAKTIEVFIKESNFNMYTNK